MIVAESEVVCPHCGCAITEVMPTDACRVLYECSGCGAKLRPKPGDCCVFCSYGSVPCPPIQAERGGEAGDLVDAVSSGEGADGNLETQIDVLVGRVDSAAAVSMLKLLNSENW